MTTYLLESTLTLLVLLGVYQLFLENQPVHRLKRIYLLGTLAVAFVAPLLTVEVPLPRPMTQPVAVALWSPAESPPIQTAAAAVAAEPSINYWLWVYGAGVLLMLGRFARNLHQIAVQVRRYRSRPFRGVWLVPLPADVLPHTFLHYLFVSKAAVEQGTLEPELLTHELAHIRQRHSLDILLIELLLCFGWFNPLLIWLKRAMQRNHEFLADEAVNIAFGNVPGYQQLLLAKLTRATALPALVSTLTFQTTKQRLLMMTKHASPARTWFAGGSTALLFCALTLALIDIDEAPAQNVPAQSKPTPVAKTAPTRLEPRQLSAEEARKEFGDDVFYGPDRKKEPVSIKKKVDSLLAAGKKVRVYFPPPLRIELTEAQWEDFKNTKKYGIWVDEKRRRDNPLSKYKRTDIVYYSRSYVHKNARQPEGYLYQLDLYTEAGYQTRLREIEASPLMVIEPDRPKARR